MVGQTDLSLCLLKKKKKFYSTLWDFFKGILLLMMTDFQRSTSNKGVSCNALTSFIAFLNVIVGVSHDYSLSSVLYLGWWHSSTKAWSADYPLALVFQQKKSNVRSLKTFNLGNNRVSPFFIPWVICFSSKQNNVSLLLERAHLMHRWILTDAVKQGLSYEQIS